MSEHTTRLEEETQPPKTAIDVTCDAIQTEDNIGVNSINVTSMRYGLGQIRKKWHQHNVFTPMNTSYLIRRENNEQQTLADFAFKALLYNRRKRASEK